MTLAATSKHIKVLERVGLVEQTVTGRQHVCRLVALPLAPAAAWLDFYESHWAERLEALEDLFRHQPDLEKEDHDRHPRRAAAPPDSRYPPPSLSGLAGTGPPATVAGSRRAPG